MKPVIAPLFALAVLLSCRNNTIKPPSFFILPKADSKNKPRDFYYNYNFIVDTNNHIYYYQIDYFRQCGFHDDWDTIPKFLGLNPCDIIEIPSNNIENFLRINMLNKKFKMTYVAYAADTVYSPGLAEILSLFKDSTNGVSYTTRKITDEETVVLAYKKADKMYWADEIKWDSTKILFQATIEKRWNENAENELKREMDKRWNEEPAKELRRAIEKEMKSNRKR
ncbi:hypothetical protein [Ferruginibacter sp.]